MNLRTRILRQSRRALAPGIDRLESRHLLSTILKPVRGPALAHHHEALRPHHAAEVERTHSGHHAATPAATLATTTGLHVVSSPAAPNGVLMATAAIADNDIWAVGYDDVQTAPPAFDSPLAEHFNGTSWSIVPTPALPSGGLNSPNAQFSDVAAASSNDVWAVGSRTGPDNPDFGEQLIEHWNGTSWSVVTSPTIEGDSLSGVTVISSNNVWAVGSSSSGALVEHWNGTSWSIVSNSVIAGAGALSAVSADSSNDLWAVGSPSILHFNGTSWSLVASHPDLDATSVTALSPTNVWVAGNVGVHIGHKTYMEAAIDHWDGTSWSIVATPNPGVDSSLNGIAAISADDIWAVGGLTSSSGPATLTEHWDGTSWTIISSPNPGNFKNGLNGVTALSDGTVVAVGFQQTQLTSAAPLILHS
jgi:hypothetical protein